MKKRLPFPSIFCGVLAASLLFFTLLCRFDNKYTWPGPRAEDGLLTLTEESMETRPLMFLAGGWEFYHGYHEPEELEGFTPDRTLYLGQYGGFELDNPAADPRGSATYRLMIDAPNGDYLLELPEIYSAYRVWVDGQERRNLGEPEPSGYRAATGSSALSLPIDGRTELVIAVSNYTSYYSGMVYPPAFGTPGAVGRLLAGRLILHSAFCAAALLVGLFCLLLGLRRGKFALAACFALLCLFVIGYAAYPLVHTLGFTGGGWYLWEKMSLYGMLLALCELAGRLCGVPERPRAAAFAAGCAVCVLVAAFPLLPCAWDGRAMRFYSAALSVYQWAAAVYLLVISAAAVRRERPGARALCCGVGIFGCSLLAQRLPPLYEPARTGWPVEWGGIAVVFVIAGILLSESVQSWRETAAAQAALAVHREQAALLERHVEATSRRIHEVQNAYSLLKFYQDSGDAGKLSAMLDRLCAQPQEAGLQVYTAHRLLNAILTAKLAHARELGIQVRQEVMGVPAGLSIDDADLCGLLANLLDNAIEGCCRLPETAEKRLLVGMQYESGIFSVIVENTAEKPRGRTAKADAAAHGHGMAIIAGIVEQYGGGEETGWRDGTYRHSVALPLQAL